MRIQGRQCPFCKKIWPENKKYRYIEHLKKERFRIKLRRLQKTAIQNNDNLLTVYGKSSIKDIIEHIKNTSISVLILSSFDLECMVLIEYPERYRIYIEGHDIKIKDIINEPIGYTIDDDSIVITLNISTYMSYIDTDIIRYVDDESSIVSRSISFKKYREGRMLDIKLKRYFFNSDVYKRILSYQKLKAD